MELVNKKNMSMDSLLRNGRENWGSTRIDSSIVKSYELATIAHDCNQTAYQLTIHGFPKHTSKKFIMLKVSTACQSCIHLQRL